MSFTICRSFHLGQDFVITWKCFAHPSQKNVMWGFGAYIVSWLEQIIEKRVQLPVIWDAMALMWIIHVMPEHVYRHQIGRWTFMIPWPSLRSRSNQGYAIKSGSMTNRQIQSNDYGIAYIHAKSQTLYSDIMMRAMRLQSPINCLLKENTKAQRHGSFWGESTGDRWIPLTKGQWRGKCFHFMTSSWNFIFTHFIFLRTCISLTNFNIIY